MINLSRAVISRTSDGITLNDPDSPWLIHVTATAGPTRITRLTVESKNGDRGITSTRLAGLPVQQIMHVAAANMTATQHPGEAYYRMLAQPKPSGHRIWPDAHWNAVARVAEWAKETGRPGGASRAIADFWGVSERPTAYRWIARGRQRLFDMAAMKSLDALPSSIISDTSTPAGGFSIWNKVCCHLSPDTSRNNVYAQDKSAPIERRS